MFSSFFFFFEKEEKIVAEGRRRERTWMVPGAEVWHQVACKEPRGAQVQHPGACTTPPGAHSSPTGGARQCPAATRDHVISGRAWRAAHKPQDAATAAPRACAHDGVRIASRCRVRRPHNGLQATAHPQAAQHRAQQQQQHPPGLLGQGKRRRKESAALNAHRVHVAHKQTNKRKQTKTVRRQQRICLSAPNTRVLRKRYIYMHRGVSPGGSDGALAAGGSL